MGIMLYRPGTSHVEHGVQCEAQKFRASDYPAVLDQGWFVDPREMGEEKGIVLPDETPELDKMEADPDYVVAPVAVDPPPTDEEIRARAKALGIRNWHNKRIETLLNEMKPEE